METQGGSRSDQAPPLRTLRFVESLACLASIDEKAFVRGLVVLVAHRGACDLERLRTHWELRRVSRPSVGVICTGHWTLHVAIGAQATDVPVVGRLGRWLVYKAARVVAVQGKTYPT